MQVLTAAPFERFALAGLSMGGYIAMEMLRQAPGRIERVALLDTSALADTPEASKRRNDLIDMSERGRFTGVSEALLPALVHSDRLGDAGLVATIKTMARNVGKDAFIRQQRAIMGRIDSRASLTAVRCPALVLCGREDTLTPLARSEEIANAIKHARLEIIEHSGHLTALERPAETSAALARWLAV